MATAEKYIHLMYLIWEQDELTAKVTEVLLERLKAGVKVHILYDWLSCISYKKDELKELAAAGAVVMPCYKRLPQINYRNHMKMVIIDGKSVYSGGMNMGQEYIDGGPRFDVWRDTSFRLSGPVVAPYLMLFASTWLYNGGKEDLATDFMPPAATSITGTRARRSRCCTPACRPPSRPSATCSSRRSPTRASASGSSRRTSCRTSR